MLIYDKGDGDDELLRNEEVSNIWTRMTQAISKIDILGSLIVVLSRLKKLTQVNTPLLFVSVYICVAAENYITKRQPYLTYI